jgi:hypothetical protein
MSRILVVFRIAASSAALLALGAGVSPAVPVADLSWDACSPIVAAKVPGPGQTEFDLFLSVTGMDAPHKSYLAEFVFTGPSPCRQIQPAPDAWRFDDGGCQGGLGSIHFAAPGKACPPLHGDSPVLFTYQELVEDSPVNGDLGVPGAMVARGAAAYPGSPQVPDPGQRYLLMRVHFDLSFAVAGAGEPGQTCGGFESPICFSLRTGHQYTVQGECVSQLGITGTSLVYVGLDDMQHPIQAGQWYATFGLTPGGSMSCFEFTPARRATWGEVKATYRD